MREHPTASGRKTRRRPLASGRVRVPLPWLAALGLLTLLCAGCSGHRDILDPASAEAARIGRLWWVFCWVCTAVFFAVGFFVLGAIRRGQREPSSESNPNVPVATATSRDRRALATVGWLTGTTVVVLFALLLVDFTAGRALLPASDPAPLTIKITGKQWWWQIEYDDPTPSQTFTTANELHLPVNRPVQLILQSSDVIHSFWIPNLHGKKDLVPGRPTTLWLHPERIGRFHGQCAEFCGFQHAHMGLLAVVEAPADFERWRDTQRKPAPEPDTPSRKRGRELFLTTTCVMCHTIQGTPASSRVGPPLTHLAGQQYIGAGSFPNRRDELARWITDPHALKPGVRMPPHAFAPAELDALLDYLQSLQ